MILKGYMGGAFSTKCMIIRAGRSREDWQFVVVFYSTKTMRALKHDLFKRMVSPCTS